LGRVLAHGGVDWLIDEIAAGRLAPASDGLVIRERRGIARPGGPRMTKCTYHDLHGCTILPERRPATCNYFVCEAALTGDDGSSVPEAGRVRSLQAALAAQFERWDAVLAAHVAVAWPDGAPFDSAFFAWLGARFDALARHAEGIDANVEAHT
jgi:hypothetical protein